MPKKFVFQEKTLKNDFENRVKGGTFVLRGPRELLRWNGRG